MKHVKKKHDLPSEYQTLLLIMCEKDTENLPFEESEYPVNENLIALADRHRLIPFLFSYLKRHPDIQYKALMDHVKELVRSSTIKSLTLQAEMLRICREFNRQEIGYLVIKGPQLSHYLYNDATKRVCVDLDLFLRNPDQLTFAAGILSEFGYKRTNYPERRGFLWRWMFMTGKHESTFINPQAGTVIDLHMRPVGNTVFSSGFHRYFFSETEKYMINTVQVPVPSKTLYFIFLCHHGAVHRYASLQWLADIYFFYLKCNFSPEELIRLSDRLKLRRHMILSLIILKRYCDIRLPQDIMDTEANSFVMKILLAGFHRNLTKDKKYEFTLKGRLDKTFYRLLLAQGFLGKTDVLVSIITRYIYRGFRLRRYI